ncbi:MAG: DUF485 domain-containing protein [Anaerolineae bacterium]
MAQSAGTLKGATKQEQDAPGTSARPEWAAIEADPDFKALVAAKRRFVIPATIFFIVYYFSLLILNGYAPQLMDQPVLGPINLALVFAMSQFIMAWIVAYLYIRRANVFDSMVAKIIAKLKGGRS